MAHQHRKKTERGPYGCAGNVRYVETCSCGCTRHVCFCHQCKEQGTNKGEWKMPICEACGLRHPLDESCQSSAIKHTEDWWAKQ